MNKDDVGKLYTIDGEDAWRLISYSGSPTATLENLETKERVSGAVGSLILEPYERLLREE